MTFSLSRFCLIAAVGSIGIVTAGSAMAESGTRLQARLQTAVAKVQNACADDLKQYCSTVTPGEGRLLLCIEAHEDKISAKCDLALFEASRNLERTLDRVQLAADACWNDIQKQCANVPPGQGGVIQCLTSNKASLGMACQRVVGKLEAAK
jgi:hypothetical protein